MKHNQERRHTHVFQRARSFPFPLNYTSAKRKHQARRPEGNCRPTRFRSSSAWPLISVYRKNFNWAKSVKSESVNEYCLLHEAITFNRGLHTRYFLWHNFFASPKKFIYLEICLHIKTTVHACYVTNQLCVCVDILHWARTHLSTLPPHVISSQTFLVYRVVNIDATLLVTPLFPLEVSMAAILRNI